MIAVTIETGKSNPQENSETKRPSGRLIADFHGEQHNLGILQLFL